MSIATLCYLFDKKNKKILMGTKKYGGAKGLLNGFGGKIEDSDKTISAAVVREFFEETTIKINKPKLRSILSFHEKNKEMVTVYLYFSSSWNGQPKETKEMKVFWLPIDKIQVEKMWPSDQLWFPIILKFENTIIDVYFDKHSPFPKRFDVKFSQKLYEDLHKGKT